MQNVQISGCEKCQAGAIGLGKPRELWAYLDLKIDSVLHLPESMATASTLRTTLAAESKMLIRDWMRRIKKGLIAEVLDEMGRKIDEH